MLLNVSPLFEPFNGKRFDAPASMKYKKPLDEILEELEENISKYRAQHNHQSLLFCYLHAIAPLSVSINEHIKHPSGFFYRSIAQEVFSSFIERKYQNALTHLAKLKLLSGNLGSKIYESREDTYTWTASHPEIIGNLAKNLVAFNPQLIIASAHGAIRSGSTLSSLLKVPLHFIRYSHFKRNDKAPIVTREDYQYLEYWQNKRIVFFDEDSQTGTTLEGFKRSFSYLSRNTVTAASIRHQMAVSRPDYVGAIIHD